MFQQNQIPALLTTGCEVEGTSQLRGKNGICFSLAAIALNPSLLQNQDKLKRFNYHILHSKKKAGTVLEGILIYS